MPTLIEFFQAAYGWSLEQATAKAEYFGQPLEGAELERKIQIGAEFINWLSKESNTND